MDFMNFRTLNGFKRPLIFQVSCLLFEISGQRFAKFAVDLNDAVATARKLAVLVWYVLTKEQEGSAYDYNIKATRDQERRRVQQAEKIYERFVAGWNRSGPRVCTSAAKEERQ